MKFSQKLQLHQPLLYNFTTRNGLLVCTYLEMFVSYRFLSLFWVNRILITTAKIPRSLKPLIFTKLITYVFSHVYFIFLFVWIMENLKTKRASWMCMLKSDLGIVLVLIQSSISFFPFFIKIILIFAYFYFFLGVFISSHLMQKMLLAKPNTFSC